MIKATSRFFRLMIKAFSVALLGIPFFFCTQAMGQKNEIGAFFGGSFYMGDINPHKLFEMPQIAAGVLYRYNFNDHLALRGNIFFGSVAASDATTKYNVNRNLHFKSQIIELSIQGEVNFLPFVAGDMETPSTPYLFAGGGAFRFNPQAEWNGQWYDLKPLRTEGQGSVIYSEREPYSLISSNILFGIGYKFNITRTFTAAFEWGMRRTGTDYLDDISTTYPDASVFNGYQPALNLYDRSLENRGENTNFQRGNPNVNDWYSFAGIVLTIRIKDRSKYSCPAYN